VIVVSGTFEVDPAKRDEAVEVGTTMAEASRAEPGCFTYGFWADLTDPARFRVFEEWESAEALAAHFNEPHMTEFLTTLRGLGVTNSDIWRYEMTGKSKLM